MNTRQRIIVISVICVVTLFLSFLYIPAYLECSEGLGLDLTCTFGGTDGFDTFSSIRHYAMMKASCNDSLGNPDMDCFMKSFENCESARIKKSLSTIEGDPLFFYATVSPEDSCSIHFEVDSSLDRYGGISKGLVKKICTDMKLEEHSITLQCSDEYHTFPLR